MSLQKFKSNLKDEAIKLALEALGKAVKNKVRNDQSTGGDNARYGAVCFNKGELELHSKSYPCHKYMKDYKSPLVVFNQYVHKKKINPDADKAYFSWITGDESPWRTFYGRNISHTSLNNSKKSTSVLDFVFKNGWVWSELDKHPSNLQHSFLTASRMPAEWPDMINTWYTRVQKGCHPGLSLAFLDVFRSETDKPKTLIINRSNRYDWPLDVCTADEEYVINFCRGKVSRLNKPYSQTQVYTPVNAIFGTTNLLFNDTNTYPNRIFSIYAPKDDTECRKYWEGRNLGISGFRYETHWCITEDECIEIIKQEEKRLEINV